MVLFVNTDTIYGVVGKLSPRLTGDVAVPYAGERAEPTRPKKKSFRNLFGLNTKKELQIVRALPLLDALYETHLPLSYCRRNF